MTRTEHLEWCKQRAREYLPADPQQAFASMMSDLRKHDELSSHMGIEMGAMLMNLPDFINDAKQVGEFCDGFN